MASSLCSRAFHRFARESPYKEAKELSQLFSNNSTATITIENIPRNLACYSVAAISHFIQKEKGLTQDEIAELQNSAIHIQFDSIEAEEKESVMSEA